MFEIGIFCSAFVGLSVPINLMFYSEIVNDFFSPIAGRFKIAVKKMAVLGAIKFVVGFIQMFCLQYSARRQAIQIRQRFFSVSPFCLFCSAINLIKVKRIK